jgi:tripartite-type tricarboxylate transporter receptor subunit TctC
MKKIVRALFCTSLALAALAPAVAPQAKDFPSKPVTLIVPNAPGGAIDILGRLLSDQLAKLWGHPVVVMYKPGANTVVGTDFVARSEPDGHTLGMVVTSHVINPSLRSALPFDTTKDLMGVSLMATAQIVISATPSFPANNIAELVALAKKDPGKLSYASPGSGSSMHLAGELLKVTASIDMLHVPYKGSGPAYPEVISGRVPLLIDPLFSSMPYIKAGRLKALAVTGPQRDPSAPTIPTVGETLPGFDVQSMFGLVVPSGTPPELVKKISADVATVLQSPDFKKRLNDIGMVPVGNTPAEFDAYIKTEIAKWAKLVKATGAIAD